MEGWMVLYTPGGSTDSSIILFTVYLMLTLVFHHNLHLILIVTLKQDLTGKQPFKVVMMTHTHI